MNKLLANRLTGNPQTPDTKPASGTRLACFSPPVMLATFIIEIILAAYVVWRYKLDVFGRLTVAMLFFLGLFQISEYFVCGGLGLTNVAWAHVGYVAITTLPPLGLHMIYVLAGRKQRRLVMTAYATGLAFIIFFLGYSQAFSGYQCTGNYVIFQLARHTGMLYGIYYYAWLLTALVLGWRWRQAGRAKGDNAKQLAIGKRQAIGGLMLGYLVFIIPTAIANTVNPATRRGIPSIMCGFAVIFALILAFYIVPRIARQRGGKA